MFGAGPYFRTATALTIVRTRPTGLTAQYLTSASTAREVGIGACAISAASLKASMSSLLATRRTAMFDVAVALVNVRSSAQDQERRRRPEPLHPPRPGSST